MKEKLPTLANKSWELFIEFNIIRFLFKYTLSKGSQGLIDSFEILVATFLHKRKFIN